MKNTVILLGFLIVNLHQALYGQDKMENDFAFYRFSISISGGAAIPVGSFGNQDFMNAAIYIPEDDVLDPWVIGFDKSKSGFAVTGVFF